jgi:hypothetical protein
LRAPGLYAARASARGLAPEIAVVTLCQHDPDMPVWMKRRGKNLRHSGKANRLYIALPLRWVLCMDPIANSVGRGVSPDSWSGRLGRSRFCKPWNRRGCATEEVVALGAGEEWFSKAHWPFRTRRRPWSLRRAPLQACMGYVYGR